MSTDHSSSVNRFIYTSESQAVMIIPIMVAKILGDTSEVFCNIFFSYPWPEFKIRDVILQPCTISHWNYRYFLINMLLSLKIIEIFISSFFFFLLVLQIIYIKILQWWYLAINQPHPISERRWKAYKCCNCIIEMGRKKVWELRLNSNQFLAKR